MSGPDDKVDPGRALDRVLVEGALPQLDALGVPRRQVAEGLIAFAFAILALEEGAGAAREAATTRIAELAERFGAR